jgi:hypothetical protein
MPVGEGTRLGAYEVQEFVGRGAMGVVYKAWHDALARPAAVKVLQALAPDSEATSRFRREAQSIAQMRHPNILNVFDFGEFEGVPYKIVEYVPGGSLAERLRAGQPPDHRHTVSVLRGLAAALDYAHSLGVVHRDVKPANVLVGRDEAPILADFGLAKLLQSASVKSATGVTTGTPAYMAPEQVTGSAVGPAADRYALAAVAYELLTGAPPFSGEGVLELLYAHVHRDPRPPSERNPQLSKAVDTVLLHGLAKRPEARWASCREMVDALEKALQGQPVAPPTAPLTTPPRAAAPLEATMVMAPNAALAAAAPAAASTPRRRFPILPMAAGAVIALVVIAVVALLLRGAGQPTLAAAPASVTAGATVRLTAHNLPAKQQGSIAIASTAQELATFKADAKGNLDQEVRIPADLSGRHDLKLCWNSACHATASISVQPERRATPAPTPTRIFTPAILVSSTSPKLGSSLRVDGHGFDPQREYSLVLAQGGKETALQSPSFVQPNGTWTANVVVPGSLQPGNAELVACVYSSGNAARADECVREQIQLQK